MAGTSGEFPGERRGGTDRRTRAPTTMLVRAEQRERRQFAAMLHDELQQLLYSVQLKLLLARDACVAERYPESARQLAHAGSLLARSIDVTRQLSVDLNPPILRTEGLRTILLWLRARMRDLYGLDVRVEADREIRVDDGDARVLLYQVFRELLFNIARHAGVKSATVELQDLGRQVCVSVSDSGKGFEVEKAPDKAHNSPAVGLASVRARLGLLGGTISIASRPGEGTRVTLCLPRMPEIGA